MNDVKRDLTDAKVRSSPTYDMGRRREWLGSESSVQIQVYTNKNNTGICLVDSIVRKAND